MLEEFLKLILRRHDFPRICLQFGQAQVEFSANHLRLFMIGTMKAQ
ncbi:hypothetical protein [Rhizobium sullae]|nr:hypothetical protein [Rhizobium sullae]